MNIEYEFPVLQESIDAGVCGNPDKCAIALAGRVYLDCLVQVNDGLILIDGVRHYMTEYLHNWVRDFDDDKTDVEPIRVILFMQDNILWADRVEGNED